RLIQLAPGVTSSSVSNPRVAGSAYWGGIQFNVDGQNLNDSGNGGAIYSAGGRTGLSNLPTIDSISELRVDSNNQKAEHEAAATVMLVSKSGSNQLHGSVYEFNRNKVFAAKDALLAGSATKAPFNRNEFGGTFGGPIRKDKTFFFVDVESLRQRIYQTNKLSVATTPMRNGDFSGLPTLMDPLADAPFANYQIPSARFDVRSRTLIGYVPQANLTGSGPAGTLNNWLGQTGQPMNVNRYGVRVDHRFSDKDSIWAKFNYSGGFPYFLAQGTPPNYGNKTASRDVWNGTFTHIHTLTPSTINEFRFGYLQTGYTANGQNDTFNPQSLFPDLYAPAQQGLGGLPNISIANHVPIGDTGGYLRSPQGTTQFIDNFTHVRGRHTLKTGVDIDRFTIATNPSATLGTFNFTGRFTNNVPASAAQPAHGFADFLLGYPNTTQRSTATGYYVIKTTRYSAYVQDDWQLSSRLTLNFGVRYSVQPAWSEQNGNQSNFDFSTGKLVLAGSTIPSLAQKRLLDALPIVTSSQAGRPNQVAETDADNFAPRFGFAFRPFRGNKTVIRGGVGMFYNFIPAFIGFRQLSGSNAPFILAETFESTAGSVPSLTLAKPFPGTGTINGNPSITAVERTIQNSVSQQWNFTLERELLPSLGFRTSYVGNKTTHLPFYNYPRNLSKQQISGALQPNRPYQPWSDISVLESGGNSTIHQLQVEAIQRYSHGASMQLEYSFNRSLDNVPVAGGPQNPQNAAIERGNSDGIARHILTLAGNYELPFGHGKQLVNSGLLGKVAGGWQLGGIAFLRTGAPFSTSFSPTLPGWRAGRPDAI
ncbi:MAG: TonB-dependent receptor, partial [Acidobacteria bacterium]|nr:TonB-dependent receptor [Acidobacteriota bacterium]